MIQKIWTEQRLNPLFLLAMATVGFVVLIALYAPFFASSKPIFLLFHGTPYFPLFRYLLFQGFFTTQIDLFFNLLSLLLPPYAVLFYFFPAQRKTITLFGVFLFLLLLTYLFFIGIKDPKSSPSSPYVALDEAISLYLNDLQAKRLGSYRIAYEREAKERAKLLEGEPLTFPIPEAKGQKSPLTLVFLPFIRPFHWEDDGGGDQLLNRLVPFYDLTRLNRRDLTAAVIFGSRISLLVGFFATLIMVAIGVPLGALAGYYRGWVDLLLSRIMEIWEAIPTLFLLLLAVSMINVQSIALIIAMIGLFGWMGFARFVRGECFKERALPYVEACRLFGFSDRYTIFVHLLPNAISPVIALLPFSIMGAITAEAGLSFLGLGVEGSCSWGALMDEARSLFPAESYLLWPPTLALTILLIAIAIIGDGVRDALDPHLKS